MNLKSFLAVTSFAVASFSFSQGTGTGIDLCPASYVMSPSWYPGVGKMNISCPDVNVGLGTLNPVDRLHIATKDNSGISLIPQSINQRSRISFLDENEGLNWNLTAYNSFTGGYGNIFELNSHKGGNFWVRNTTMMVGDYFDLSCTDCSDYLLFVRKGIRTEEVKVDVAAGTWADYVFKEDYKLMPLEQVKTYIDENGHLPNVPSAEEVEENGVKVGEMNAKLLEKIEELTLYTIALKEEMEALKLQVNENL